MEKPTNPPQNGKFPRFAVIALVGCTLLLGTVVSLAATGKTSRFVDQLPESFSLSSKSIDEPSNSKIETIPRRARHARSVNEGWGLRTNESNENTVYERDSDEISDELRINNGHKARGYNATLKVYLPGYSNFPKEKYFLIEGKVSMNFELNLKSGQPIILNVKNMKLDEESICLTAMPMNSHSHTDRKVLHINKIKYLPEREQVHFYSKEEDLDKLENTDYIFTLELSYTAFIGSTLSGMYRSGYTAENGQLKYAAVTQMEPMEARSVIPCVDQPNVRDVFTFTIIHPAGTNALANGKEAGTKRIDEHFLSTSFEPTPSMSTYILAIFVSEFKYIEGRTKNNVRMRVWARPERIDSAKFALSAGIKSLEFFENTFGILFPIPKLDMVAVNDFAFGAMENYGLVIYRESLLLLDENEENKIVIARIIAHELSHQWFGNRATTSFWHTSWLNEGFATLMQYYGLQNVVPIMPWFTTHIRTSVQTALREDAWASSVPVTRNMTTVAEVNEVFDKMTYEKAGTVITMLQSIYGRETFWKSLKDYLTDREYKSTTPSILAEAFQKNTPRTLLGADGKILNAKDLIYQWTTQMGYPVLTTSRLNNNTVRVTQSRFKKNELAHEIEKYANPQHGFKWDVFVKYRTGPNSTVQSVWLPRDKPLDIVCDSNSPVILNVGGFGMYRQNFDSDEWDIVIKHMQTHSQDYDRHTRYSLIFDAFEMASVGKMTYQQLFDLLLTSKNTMDGLIREAVRNGMYGLVKLYENESDKKLLNTFTNKLLAPKKKQFKSSSQAKSEIDYIELSSNLLEEESYAPDTCTTEDCSSELNRTSSLLKFALKKCPEGSMTSKCVKISEEDRQKAYSFYVEHGGQAEFDNIMSFYERETDSKEKTRLLQALTATRNKDNLMLLLDRALNVSSNFVRFQKANTVVGFVSQNNLSKKFFMSYFKTHWTQIYESFHSHHGTVASLIKSFSIHIQTQKELKEFERFFKSAEYAEKFYVFHRIIDETTFKIGWVKKYSKEVIRVVRKQLEMF